MSFGSTSAVALHERPEARIERPPMVTVDPVQVTALKRSFGRRLGLGERRTHSGLLLPHRSRQRR